MGNSKIGETGSDFEVNLKMKIYSSSIQDLAHEDVVECSLTSIISSDAGWFFEF